MNQQQPPALRPKYLLDTERWQVRLYDACWQDADRVLQRQGYGAISYSWGRWRDRRDGQTVLDNPDYPTFDIGFRTDVGHVGERLGWSFIIVRPVHPQTGALMEAGEQFTIRDIQAVFNSMGRRFIWWDWACIPQNLTQNSPQVLRDDAANEMNKMRYVYPHATRGTIWAHDVASWNIDQPVLGNAIQVCTRFFGMRANPRTLNDVTNVVQALKAAEANEAWFRSLWCFQEGVLFSHNNNFGGAVIRDRRGASIAAEAALSGEGDLLTLVAVASGIVATIINAIRVRAETPDRNNNNQIQPPNNANAVNMNFTTWCSLAGSEPEARWIINRLVSTGLVFLASQNPLSILNARFNRERGQWASAEDLEVNTIIGALEVDIAQYQIQANAQHPDRDDANARAARLVITREGMLTQLFNIYQWRMLLFATPLRELNQPPPTAIWSSLVRIGQAMHPSYASLEYFLSTQYLSDRFCPPPPPLQGQVPVLPRLQLAVPQGQVALPELEYVTGAVPNVNDNSGVLVLRSMAGYRLFRLANRQPGFWTKCMFYAYHDADPPQPPPGVQVQPNANNEPRAGTYMCRFRTVEQGRWQEAFGPDAVLVPVEYLNVNTAVAWAAHKRLRCVVLNRFSQNATAAGYPAVQMARLNPGQAYWAGVFVGVVDLERAGSYIQLGEGDLGLTSDVVMF